MGCSISCIRIARLLPKGRMFLNHLHNSWLRYLSPMWNYGRNIQASLLLGCKCSPGFRSLWWRACLLLFRNHSHQCRFLSLPWSVFRSPGMLPNCPMLRTRRNSSFQCRLASHLRSSCSLILQACLLLFRNHSHQCSSLSCFVNCCCSCPILHTHHSSSFPCSHPAPLSHLQCRY